LAKAYPLCKYLQCKLKDKKDGRYKLIYKNLKILTKKSVFKEIKKIFPSLIENYFSFVSLKNFSFFPVHHLKKCKPMGSYLKVKKFACIPDTKGIGENSIKKFRSLNIRWNMRR